MDDEQILSENYNPLHEVLNTIERYDPQGGDHVPTEADIAGHEAWARTQYGDDAWAAYCRGGWADPWY